MLDRGCGLIVGTCSPDGEPQAERAWGARVVDESARRLRVTMSADDERVVGDLVVGRWISVTGADVYTLAAVQMKGPITWCGSADDNDLALMAQQSDLFIEAIHAVDRNPVEHLRRMLPLEVITIEFEVVEVFDQSAGPDAGAPVRSA
ncbi:MAG: hypothetical protein U0Q03_05035 [Acidimicrobiales bacterium]